MGEEPAAAAAGDDDTTLDSATTSTTIENGDGDQSEPLDLDSISIYHQVDQAENSLYRMLVKGFQSLREGRENKQKPLFSLDPGGDEDPKPEDDAFKLILNYVTVNIVDPTTVSSDNASSSTNSSAPKIENIYDKISFIFKRDYGSTLRSVQYRSMRSGDNDLISSLPVQMVLSRSGGGSDNGDANAPWGGTAAGPVTGDPSEWHTVPFCYVYVAACESMDQYRTRIKAQLQVFISQIESAAKTSELKGDQQQQQGGTAQCLIVYVPTGSKDAAPPPVPPVEKMTEAAAASVRRGFGHRIRKAQQRITSYSSSEKELSESQHSGHSFDSDGGVSDIDNSDSGSVALNLLTKDERSIYKRFAGDFPNAKVCVMSISSLDTSDDEAAMASRTQEWNSFNRTLGAVIGNGFKDRCRRYNEELRKMDTQRMFATTGMSPEGKSKTMNAPAPFNPTHFFLVKESLAFTCEQMQLPSEALLQYDEFKAHLPDAIDKEDSKTKKGKRTSKALTDASSPTLVELADSGDYIAFRRKIRSEFELAPIADIVRRYLFARELCLLFKMEQPRELVSRCEAFAKNMYSTMMRDLSDLSVEEQRKRKVVAAKWFVQFSWDVKSASEQFFSSLDITKSGTDAISIDTSSGIFSDLSDTSQVDHLIANQLCELLEVSRLFLKELGDTELHEPNPIRAHDNKLPEDLFKSWDYWVPVDPAEVEDSSEVALASNMSTSFRQSLDIGTERIFLLSSAFESVDSYESTYRELLSAIVTLGRYADRRRLAARLQGEMAESFIRKGDFKGAAMIYKSIVKMCKSDQWDRCHFWRLFRLAYCQRSTAKPAEYLKTLVTCFSPRLSAIAPPLALEALQEDLDVVMGHPDIGLSRYGKLICLDTELKIDETSSGKSSIGKGVDEKKLFKRYCSVGENIKIMLSIRSFLPRPIYLESLKVFVLSSGSFSKIIKNQESIEEEDAVQILSLEPPIELKPGKNTFEYNWKPASSGQYILSTVEILWKEGYFYYDSMELPAPLLGVDVVPTEPTQKLSLDPGYLVPGQDQQIRVTFDAGSDMVTAAKIQLACAEGISLVPPGIDPSSGEWQRNCEIELDSVKPGEKKVLTTHVRCGLRGLFSSESISQIPSFDEAHGLSAKASTTYLHDETDSDPSNIPSMNCVLEAFAPILAKTALSVESVDIVWVTKGESCLLSISLMSNTPHHFFVDEWSLSLPSPLLLSEGGDLNSDFRKCRVSDGDELALTFECSLSGEKDSGSVDEPALNVQLRDDDGKIYSIDLSIDLNEFLLKLWNLEIPKPLQLTVSLELETSEGNSSEPVMMTYKVDLSGLGSVEQDNDSKLLYSISYEDSSWLVGGKINGAIDISSNPSPSCEVLAIPTSPGILDRFPSIILRYASASRSSPVKVLLKHPNSFRSLPRGNEMAIAFPEKVSV